ncbi:MAG TPA: hypothetical protein VFY73_11005 [Ideonella sp.]|uniref:hypothetical protein n=1 Tax=Ideonella sp. TaxID=1929293 RepID=UPI002E331601|nr:hypothetical protein [Ideonella sp.]HEX5684549.1 hypothetical protein [Ideonella sp.]
MRRLSAAYLLLLLPALAAADANWRRPITAPQDFLSGEPEPAIELNEACKGAVAPKLATVRHVRLADTEVRALETCMKEPIGPPGKVIHAVRAVRVGSSGGAYQVYFNKTQAFVFHGSFDKLPLTDAVVLLATDFEISDSFADAATLD